MKTFGGFISAIAATALLVAIAATPSDAASRPVRGGASVYNGLWSVSIYTDAGPCDPSYRYPAIITNGQVRQADNDFSYQISGVVTSAGGISVTVSKDGQSATGYGRLNGKMGGGYWKTDGGQCYGKWTAMRRS